MRNKTKPKNRYDSISSENLREFDEYWDYESNPNPTAADYLIWLVEKGFDEDADEAKAKILDSLSEDGAEVSQAMSKLVEIETKRVTLRKTLEDVEEVRSPIDPVEKQLTQMDKEMEILSAAVDEIKRSLRI